LGFRKTLRGPKGPEFSSSQGGGKNPRIVDVGMVLIGRGGELNRVGTGGGQVLLEKRGISGPGGGGSSMAEGTVRQKGL